MTKKNCLLPIAEKLNEVNQRCENNKFFYWVDCICAFLLAVCQLLQHYVGPLYNAGISALIIIAVYLICRMVLDLPNVKFSNILFVLPMVVYQLFRVVNHGTSMTEFGQSGVFIIFMFALALGKINTGMVLKVCRGVSLVASCLLILQTAAYYVFGVHLQMVVTSWLIPAADQWIGGVQTGLISITGRVNNFYRPTAFFLEPAHVYIYMFPHLLLLLMGEKMTKKSFWMAVLISCGMMLCTSGMGIAAVAGSWAIFFLFRNHKDGTFALKNMFCKRNLIALGVLVAAFAAVVIFVPSARRAVSRILIPNANGTTAISGRISKALKMVFGMTLPQWIMGVADDTRGIGFHIPGFIDVLYRHGLIGFALSYELYVKCTVKLSLPYKLVGVVVLVTSIFSAHTHSTIGMLYFLLILMHGFQKMDSKCSSVKTYRVQEEKENKCPIFRAL